MPSTALENLRNQLDADSGKAVLLSVDYLTTGLQDGSVTVPSDLNDSLKQAFQSGIDGLNVQYPAGNVGPVSDGAFQVTSVSATFLGLPLDKVLVLEFTISNDGSDQTLVMTITLSPTTWNWNDLSPLSTGYPFDIAVISGTKFVFTSGTGATQAFSATLAPPDQFKPVVGIIENLSFPSGGLAISGTFDFSKVDGQNVFMPSGTLSAKFQGTFENLKLGALTLASPEFGFSISAPVKVDGGDDSNDFTVVDEVIGSADEDDESFYDQFVSLYLGLDLSLDDNTGTPVVYQLRAYAKPAGQASDISFDFSLMPPAGQEKLLTPATVIRLISGPPANFFNGTPPQLQQFLAGVGLRNLSLAGSIGQNFTPTITSTTISIGADNTVINEDHPYSFLSDNTNSLQFGITDFGLDWTYTNNRGTAEYSFLFTTEFILFPEVFTKSDGTPGGTFNVEFNSSMLFIASFDGQATLDNLLNKLSGGTVSFPDSFISVALSDFKLSLDVPNKTYSFFSGLDIAVEMIKIADKPILSLTDGQIGFSAITPTDSGNQNGGQNADGQQVMAPAPKTSYRASLKGLVGIGPLYANCSVDYDGTQTPAEWVISAHLAQPIEVSELVEQFLNLGGGFQYPDFLSSSLTVTKAGIDATLQSGSTPQNNYTVSGSLQWRFALGDFSVDTEADLELTHDGSKPAGEQYSGSVKTKWEFSFLNDEVLLSYAFSDTNSGSNATLSVSWEGVTATYTTQDKTLVFTLKNWSLGTLITKLMRTLGQPYFTLPAPWDVLNQVSLDGLLLKMDLSSGSARNITAEYKLPSPINLGFLTIIGINFGREGSGGSGQLMLSIDGTAIFHGNTPEEQQQWNNLLDKDKGQPVDQLPTVPGQGNQYFDVPLLMLGQRIGIAGSADFKDVEDVIDNLQNVPSTTTGGSNPIDPSDQTPPAGTPYYNQSSNWLIAGHLQLLKTGKDWTVDLKIVFNDPDLYGLRVALAGPSAKVLAGFVVDIIYKRISDDVGVYQVNWKFPDSIRNLNFGAVSVVLPEIGVKIYTNGDFLIDLGFPYQMNFQRSFSVSAIIYGVPVLGAGGIYFGKLSNATSTVTPPTNKGTFDPVIVFGIGVQLGLGYNLVKGPLKAGFALTVFGILEGVIAKYHAFQPYNPGANTPVQTDYYFLVKGTVGLIGQLYGTVDFKIISASVNARITLSVSLIYESYTDIPIVATASVSVSVSVKIDLGLFSIKISFSFHTSVTAKFVISAPDQGNAPWDDASSSVVFFARSRAPRHPSHAALKRALDVDFLMAPNPKAVTRTATQPTLNLYLMPQFTVLADEGVTNYADQTGAFAVLFAMDAPSAANITGDGGATSFETFCQDFLPWIVNALDGTGGSDMDIAVAAAEIVTKEELERFVNQLSQPETTPITFKQLLTFLSSFSVTITLPDASNKDEVTKALEKGSVLFPVFDGLIVAAPDTAGTGTVSIDFETYATIDETWRQNVQKIFTELAAILNLSDPDDSDQTSFAADGGGSSSVSSFLFTDALILVARSLLNAGLGAMDDYTFDLGSLSKPEDNSVNGLLRWANTTMGNALNAHDVITPNVEHALSTGLRLTIPACTYTVQSGDTLSTVAARYTDGGASPRWAATVADIVNANGPSRSIAPGIPVTVTGGSGTVTTAQGMSFNELAAELGLDLARLASAPETGGIEGLLAPSKPLTIPQFDYTTAANDTIKLVAGLFATTEDALFADRLNWDASPLFSTADSKTISLAELDSLTLTALWNSIAGADQIAQIAGMLSRFLAFGMRLPSDPEGGGGLTLADGFLYPKTQNAYGLYQLSGQQFPSPTQAGSGYAVTLAKKDSVQGVDLDFVTISGSGVPLDTAYANLSKVLAYAQEGKFQPAPTVTFLPSSIRQPQSFPIKGVSIWSTSALPALQSIASAGARQADSDAPQTQPMLWSVPPALLNLATTRAGTLASALTFDRYVEYMPKFVPTVRSTDPASNATTVEAVSDFFFSTRIDFTIKKLPTGNPIDSTGTTAVDYTYVLEGASAEDTKTLQYLVEALEDLGKAGIASPIAETFILTAQGGGSTPKLTSQATSEFLAYLTQTNLSTETNPATGGLALFAAEPAPRGIANPREEFVALLWELSTVRSGGYYLSYLDVTTGEGLPDSLFDSSGAATLTVVIAYSRGDEGPTQDRLTSFINSFVTTDLAVGQNSQVSLDSGATETKGLPTQAEDSLATLGGFYGIGAGRVAEINSNGPLEAAARLPVQNLVHLVSPDDTANGGDSTSILDTIAAYYSVGAVTAITGTDIANINPGVTVAVGVALFIPTITYAVSNSGPGNTFQSIATYYRTTVDHIAAFASDVSGIFPTGTTPDINSQIFDLQPNQAPGNISFEVSRINPGEPGNPDTDSDGYASAYLYSLYSVLSAGLATSPYFKPVSARIPFGPQGDDGAGSSSKGAEAMLLGEPHHKRMRDPAARRQMLAELATVDTYTYRQSLGIARQATKNAAPDNSGSPDLPQAADNPYIGVATFAQLDLKWLDIFGNILITPFEKQPERYSGSPNNLPMTLLYTDRLISPDAWPNLQLHYGYAPAPTLALEFALDATGYSTVPEGQTLDSFLKHVTQDLRTYQAVYYQLNQSYANLTLPWSDRSATTVTVTNSLFKNGRSTLTGVQLKPIIDYLDAVITYLAKIVTEGKAQPPANPIVQTTGLPVSVSDVVDDNIIPLSVAFEIKREKALVDPAVAALKNGTSVVSYVLPKPDPEAGGGESYSQFATAFESVFRVEQSWYSRVGQGTAERGESPDGRDQTLWAVRFGHEKAGPGIYYDLDTQPNFFAPLPVATSLLSAQVSIRPTFDPNTPFDQVPLQSMTFTGIDPNVWMEQSLKAIDNFLSPLYAQPAFLLDKLNGFDDPLDQNSGAALGRLLKVKDELASAIASVVRPVLGTTPTSGPIWSAAKDKFEQALKIKLSSSFTTTAIVGFGVDAAPNGKALSLFGQPSDKTSAAAGNSNRSFSTGRIPVTTDGATAMATLFNTQNELDSAYVPVNVRYAITHVEHDARKLVGDYTASNWISLITGPITIDIGAMDIPVLLRALPKPPTVQEQRADQYSGKLEKPSDLAKWNYSFRYLYSAAIQDSAIVEINLNVPHQGEQETTPTTALETALAQFATVYPSIEAALQETLVPLNGVAPTQDQIALATNTVKAFVAIAGDLSSKYKNWADSQNAALDTLATAQNPALTVAFRLTLASQEGGDESVAVTEISELTINNKPATYSIADQTISATLESIGEVTLPAPVVEIDPSAYSAEFTDPHNSNVQIAYRYAKKDTLPVEYLGLDAALANPERTVTMGPLNALRFQNAWSALQILRNVVLFPGNEIGKVSTNPAFIFASPAVRFTNSIVPRNDFASYSLDGLKVAAADTADYLGAFVVALGEDGGAPARISLESRYSYQISDFVPQRAVLPVSMMLPSDFTPGGDTVPAFVEAVGTYMDQWRDDSRVTTSGNAQIDFELKIFTQSTDAGQQAVDPPIIEVDHLVLSADKVPLTNNEGD